MSSFSFVVWIRREIVRALATAFACIKLPLFVCDQLPVIIHSVHIYPGESSAIKCCCPFAVMYCYLPRLFVESTHFWYSRPFWKWLHFPPRRFFCTNPRKMAEASKRNVEIKARIADDAEFDRRVQIAKDLCNTEGELLKQHDIFYKVNDGRLKLRIQVRT